MMGPVELWFVMVCDDLSDDKGISLPSSEKGRCSKTVKPAGGRHFRLPSSECFSIEGSRTVCMKRIV